MHLSGHHATRAALAAAVSAALLIGTPATAGARVDDATLTPHTHFVMAADGSSGSTARGADIPNIDSVKSTIRTYYNASSAGIANKDSSPYITEIKALEANVLAQIPQAPAPNLAVVFDADDTTLSTYDMEDGAMHFNFDPALQNTYVQQRKFPATPGMVDFVAAVKAKGYDIYGITGRTNDQEAATLANLQDVGYTEFDADNFFTKWTAQPGGTALPQPSYVDCAADSDASKCSTVEYKAATRRHIQDDLGKTIVLNIGDQFSDLQGGYALHNVKLPNPTYYLPSLDLTTPGPGDPAGQPRTEFDMAADGSSGATEGGEGIPNIDSVKSTIRTYYGAVNGRANTSASPYVSEMKALAATWSDKLAKSCARGVRKHQKPAVVFDADDTTLMTYDMEDAAMHFNFDPALQNTFVQEERFPATPGMVKVVRTAARNGCKVVGLTGRNNAQRTATLDNLAKFYFSKKTDQPLFRSQYYFTKFTSTDTPPAYVDCAQDADATKCSTIEYKSSTRNYVEDHYGFRIVANFGDQFSDLIGGHSAKVVKLPNPTYYLP
ncbi:hypothetical protein H5V45_15850 [Nocardioides sp. KIGAM211]|uniref:Acid phosphatase of HAD superfamily subfamily IIIB n=1 Tax=Nocardioides luti TaxID=2761101 RepID=A0A7X0RI82_9ACTN|nr:HAD family acid phosphatase [Nocardioides luti]MBB6628801.1 hypothetical protein [Nocardioides luti]